MPTTFRQAMPQFWAQAQVYPGPKVCELLIVQSPAVRRLLRGLSSGQAAVTEAAAVVVGLAWLHPERLLDQETPDDHVQRARLRKTYNNRDLNRTRSIVLATRGMAALEQAASLCGLAAEWITEGLDMEKIAEILAVPADHAVLGLVALHAAPGKVTEQDEFRWGGFMVNGFGGSWPKL